MTFPAEEARRNRWERVAARQTVSALPIRPSPLTEKMKNDRPEASIKSLSVVGRWSE
jgi:hypothetical protein